MLMMSNRQIGFTLVELMIALTLGLVVVAAGLAIFLSGHRVLALQTAMDELQQNANFGLGVIAYDLRKSNLNTGSAQINNQNKGSGIIFGQANLPASIQSVPQNIWTAEKSAEGATDTKSDQLLIQYVPKYESRRGGQGVSANSTTAAATLYQGGYDCEGKKIEFRLDPQTSNTQNNRAQNDNAQNDNAQNNNGPAAQRVIVSRYYIKKDPQQIAGEPEGYSLFCQSGYYVAGDRQITGLNGNGGQQIIKRVDAFKIRLGVRAADGRLRYVSIDQYRELMPKVSENTVQNNYNVVSIELGLLIRASSALGTEPLLDAAQRYELLGSELILKDNQKQSKKYLRQNISQVVAFRNALGDNL